MMNKLIFPLLVFVQAGLAQPKLQTAFVVKEKDLIAEGIAYDPFTKTFFLGSIHKQKIVKISEGGQVSDFVSTGQDGIKSVLGMKVDSQGRLWACNNTPESDTINNESNIHIYDKEGALVKRITLSDGKKHLFNDLHFLDNGDAYVTDSEGGGVFRIRKGTETLEEFVPQGSLGYPNGITASADSKKIFIATGSGMGIVAADVSTGKMEAVRHERFMLLGIDGLYRHGNSLIGIQNYIFPEAVIRYQLSYNGGTIERMEFMASNETRFDTPTTGVIAGGYFYFIANSQLMQVVRNRGQIRNPQKLNDTVIMKIKLN